MDLNPFYDDYVVIIIHIFIVSIKAFRNIDSELPISRTKKRGVLFASLLAPLLPGLKLKHTWTSRGTPVLFIFTVRPVCGFYIVPLLPGW